MLPSILQGYEPQLALLLRVALILVATSLISRVAGKLLDRRFRKFTSRMEVSRTSSVLLRRLMKVSIWLVGIGVAIYTVPQLRSLSTALFASAGFLSIVVGFAAKDALGNVVSGIFIAMFEPFRVGDKIETRTQYGEVEDITLRHTVLKSPSNERIIMPNSSILNDDIKNYSIIDEKSRYSVPVTISYSDDIGEARDIILDVADTHELTETGESTVIAKDLGDNGVTLDLRIWGHDRGEVWQAGQEIREQIKERFDEEGITIPFPQRTLHNGRVLEQHPTEDDAQRTIHNGDEDSTQGTPDDG